MSTVLNELEKSFPIDCRNDIESGKAKVVFKYTNFAIVDADDASLFEILPLVLSTYGYCIAIPYKNKTKIGYTSFGEIICRKKGKVTFKNRFKFDYRKSNLLIENWDTKK